MTTNDLYGRLLAAVALDGDDAGIRFDTTLQPTGGQGNRLMPPTYPGGYVSTTRFIDGGQRSTVLLDSYQSQANRLEEALLDARDEGRIALPMFEMRVAAEPWNIRLTSLDFPHRYADAYLRDSEIGGVKFDKTDIGKAFRIAEAADASALYVHDPVSLVLGAWNSQRAGRQPKFARCYRSEVIGLDAVEDSRRGGRLDPLNLQGSVDDKAKREGDWKFMGDSETKKAGTKLSEIGHGNALAREGGPGGVTVSEARRLGGLSFAALARLRFGDAGREATLAARAALAALALASDRLAFGAAGWVFRSGCELTVISDRIGFETRGGGFDEVAVSPSDALDLFAHAVQRAKDAGLAMSTDTVAIDPTAQLRKAIEHALITADAGE